MAKLITESSYNVQPVIEESEGQEKRFFIEGVFSSAERMNHNGRVYPKKILEREVDRIMESQIKQKRCFGELSHPNSVDVNLDRAAILVKEVHWEGNDLLGKALVLDTPMGNIVKALCKDGSIGISSRGLGTVDEETKQVNEDYSLRCWDVVGAPSNPVSWVNGIYEGREFKIIEIEEEPKSQPVMEELMEEDENPAQTLESFFASWQYEKYQRKMMSLNESFVEFIALRNV